MTRSIRWAKVLCVLLLAGCKGSSDRQLEVCLPAEFACEGAYLLKVFTIIPTQDASCTPLLGGRSRPGEAGYTVEAEESLPVGPKGPPVLRRVGAGVRIFYSELTQEGEDDVLFRGCIQVETGEARQISLMLLPACSFGLPTSERCDGVDNDCDGQTDEGDPEKLCPPAPHSRALSCAGGQCQYDCDAGWQDANQELVDGCECDEAARQVEVCDGLDNDCDGTVDGPQCLRCARDEDCAKPNPCMSGTCVDGSCLLTALPDNTPCDDGAYCTAEDRCQAGVCTGSRRDCSALDGPCLRGTCAEEQDRCVPVTLPAGTSCSDGLYCSVNDQCDAAGQCAGSPRDCSGIQNTCNQGVCSEDKDKCMGQPRPDGTACSDSEICTLNDHCEAGVCQGSAVATCSDLNPPLIAWNFNTDGNSEGWTAAHSLSGAVQGGSFGLSITGSDPYLVSPSSIQADAAFYSHVRVRLEGSLGDDQAQIYFITAADGAWSETKRVDFAVRPNAAFTEYVVDMRTNAAWKGTIRAIRLDPSKEGSGGGFKLDFIRLEGRMGFDNGAFYLLLARHSGKCADVADYSTADGGNVHQWQCHGKTNQQWKLEIAEDGYYWLSSRNSGKVLDVAGVSLGSGANIQQWSRNSQDNQKWKLVPIGQGFYKLQAKHSGKLMNVSNGSYDDGANIQQWEDLNGQNQQWTLQRVP